VATREGYLNVRASRSRTWRDWVLKSPRALPEAFFIAKAGDSYVGQSDVGRSEGVADVLYTGFAGVRREHRRGIAMTLKLRAIDYAKRHEYREIRTWNNTLNAPMLGINVKVGFVSSPCGSRSGRTSPNRDERRLSPRSVPRNECLSSSDVLQKYYWVRTSQIPAPMTASR